MSTRRVMLWIERVSNSPPMKTCTAIAATFRRIASSMLIAISSSESSFRMLGPPLARSTIAARVGRAECTCAGCRACSISVSAYGSERHDVEVDPLEPAGRPHEVAVVEGQHHRAPGPGIEDVGEAVLHAPVEVVRALQEERLVGLGNVRPIALRGCGVGIGHGGASLRAEFAPGRQRTLQNTGVYSLREAV